MKIIILTSRFPFPLEKGDKLRIYNQIKHLAENNEVILITLSSKKVTEENLNRLKSFCKEVYVFQLSKLDLSVNLLRSIFNGLPFQVGIFFKKSYKKKIQNLIKKIKPDAVYCHLIRMSEYVKDMNTFPKTLDYMDAFSKGIERRAETSSPLMRSLLRFEHSRLVKYETSIFDKFERKVIISEQDRDLIPHKEKEKIEILPNGVDHNIFYPIEREKKYDLLFTGNMGYPPNIESAIYTAKKILPLIHKNVDSRINLLIAGVKPPREVTNLHCDKIHVVTEFSHIREAFAQSKIMLAPMLISIGLQNKILQAMAMKIPCVCSSLANNAIKAPNNICILEANNPEEYVEKVQMLLENNELLNEIVENAYNFVRKNYNWKVLNTKLERTIL